MTSIIRPNKEKTVRLADGNGGASMRELIESCFFQSFREASVGSLAPYPDDSAVLPADSRKLVVTTDGFTVTPLEFPGGDIGKLAVCGVVNDLLACGASARYLTLGVILEEGLEYSVLRRCMKSFAREAQRARLHVVTGDTKVVSKGEGGGIYLNVTAFGYLDDSLQLDMGSIQAGDKVVVSGPIGEHGVAVLLARDDYGLRANLHSDCVSLTHVLDAVKSVPGVRFMRDPTRGGVASVCHEIAQATGLSVLLDEKTIPLRPEVESVCELLGYDPLYLTCEGRMLFVVDANTAEGLVHALKQYPDAGRAAVIGEIRQQSTSACVVLKTELGGERIVQELEDDPLPRIC